MFDAHPLNGTENLGAINCILRVAMNSSILEFMVNISSSSGRKFDSLHIVRTSNQRIVSGTTMMLPVDIYSLSLSVLTSSGYQYANFTMTVNISHSNYFASTSLPTPSVLSGRPVTLGKLGECLLSFIHVACTCVMEKL